MVFKEKKTLSYRQIILCVLVWNIYSLSSFFCVSVTNKHLLSHGSAGELNMVVSPHSRYSHRSSAADVSFWGSPIKRYTLKLIHVTGPHSSGCGLKVFPDVSPPHNTCSFLRNSQHRINVSMLNDFGSSTEGWINVDKRNCKCMYLSVNLTKY